MNNNNNNTGNCNVGDRNVGVRNVGDRNVGDWNVGDYNVGDWNVGDWNVGNWNVGDCNVGVKNVGDWNKCDKSTGFFNTVTPNTVLVFNKPFPFDKFSVHPKPSWIFFDLTEWVSATIMSDQEKLDNPTYKTTGGYLKKYTYKEAWANAYKNATDKDIALTLQLPNFDYDVFKEISGIDLRKHGRDCCVNKVVEIDGKKYKLTEVK